MPNAANSAVDQLRTDLNRVKSSLSRSRGKQVQAKSITEGSKAVVEDYFNARRSELSSRGLDDESLGGLDALMQELLRLTQRASLKTRYDQVLKQINQELNGVEVAALAPHGSGDATSNSLDGKEQRIAETLDGLVSSAGISYRQACRDLREADRLSYRGAATELREALREALDHLAPDDDVTSQAGFKPEKDQTKPTMKQKVRYILKSRGKNKTVSDAPEKAVEIVEEMVGALARSVYNRSSLSTHVGTTKQEVQQVKAYVDVVLGELLEIA